MSDINVSAALTQADQFRQDSRIIEAKRLIAEALGDHATKLDSVRPADESLVASYGNWMDRAAAPRGGPTIWPYLSSGLGNGPFVELADGSVKLDFIGGIGVHGCGHSSPAMTDATLDAAIEDVVMQGNLQQNPASVVMAEKLIELACQSGADLRHCMLSTSGAMANENALKIALHHRTPADRIIAFDNAFAGRSIALAALTDRPNYRAGLPLALAVDYLPALDPRNPQRSQRWAVDELKRLVARHPGRHAAFWAEPIAGEGGYYPGSHDFFAALAGVLREADVPIIFDEVQTFARTSQPFAFQHYELDEFADIVTVGKITQVCATLYRPELKPTGPILSQTFTGATASIAAGVRMLDVLREAKCFGVDGQNTIRHKYFAERLTELADRHPAKLSGPYGEGMMIAFTPGKGSFDEAKALMDVMYDVGLLGFVCGSEPTRVRFLPPPAITNIEHIDLAVELLDQSLGRWNA